MHYRTWASGTTAEIPRIGDTSMAIKPRRVMVMMEVETHLPVKSLRQAQLIVGDAYRYETGTITTTWNDGTGGESEIIKPVNKPKVEVVGPVKAKKGRKR